MAAEKWIYVLLRVFVVVSSLEIQIQTQERYFIGRPEKALCSRLDVSNFEKKGT